MMKVGYYPGCSLEGTAREFDESIRAIAPGIGLELTEVEDWNCCGATSAHAVNHLLSLTLPARILGQAGKQGLTSVFVPCAACYARLMRVQVSTAKNPELKAEVETIIEMPLPEKMKILSYPEMVLELGLDNLKPFIKRPLTGLKIASYYGCLLVRPPELAPFEDCEAPVSLDKLAAVLGATPIEWAFKAECCGAAFTLSRADIVVELSSKILNNAQKNGADCIMVACPMCHANLDMRQGDIKKKTGVDYKMPILYASQVMGLAMGLSEKKLGLNDHFVDTRPAIEKIGKQ